MIIKGFLHSNSITISWSLPAVGTYLGDTLSLPARLIFDMKGTYAGSGSNLRMVTAPILAGAH
jgi:hypothetical protein